MRVVPAFDETKDRNLSLGAATPGMPIDQFAFQSGEEDCAHRVVKAIADRTH